MAKKTPEERRAERTGRHVSNIREMIGNSPGEKVDISTLRHWADQMETDHGDESLHDALDLTEHDLIQHNKAVHRESAGALGGTPRTIQEARNRAQETRRTQEMFRETKRQEKERKAALSPVAPMNAGHPSRMRHGVPEGPGRFQNKQAPRRVRPWSNRAPKRSSSAPPKRKRATPAPTPGRRSEVPISAGLTIPNVWRSDAEQRGGTP